MMIRYSCGSSRIGIPQEHELPDDFLPRDRLDFRIWYLKQVKIEIVHVA